MRYTPMLMLLVLLGILQLPVQGTPQRQPEVGPSTPQLKKAEKLLQGYEYEKAIRLLEQVIETTSEPSFEALWLLANAHLDTAQYSEALVTTDSMIEIAGSSERLGKAYSLLGRALFEKNVNEDVEFYSPRAAVDRLLGLAVSLRSENPQRLEEHLRESLKEKGDFESSQSTLLEEAATALRQAIDLRGDPAFLDHYLLAEVLVRLDRTDEARSHLDRYFEFGDDSDMPLGPRGLRCRLETEVFDDLTMSGFTPPRRIRRGPADYTRKAARRKIQGAVFLEAVIDERGKVRCARPLCSLPLGLTEKAIKAFEKSEFEPARLHGEPIAVTYKAAVQFRILAGGRTSAVELQRRRLSHPFAQ